MTHRFSLPACPELGESARQLFDTPKDASLDVLRARVKAVAMAYVDSIVDGMILALISPADVGTRTESLVRNLAGLIKSVTHGLVGSATSGAKKSEIEAVSAYMRQQLVLEEARTTIDFVLADETREGFLEVIAALRNGKVEAERERLVITMLAFVDEALHHYLVGPFALVSLGFLTRKAFDVGHSSIRAGARTAIKHSLGPGSDGDVEHLVLFFDRTIKRAA
jgi:hypothetical protein